MQCSVVWIACVVCVGMQCVWCAGGEGRGGGGIVYTVMAKKGFRSKYVFTTPTISLISAMLML